MVARCSRILSSSSRRRRDVPLVVAHFVDELTDGLSRRAAEVTVEGAIGAFDAQLMIEHEQRLAHRLDRVLGELPRHGSGLLAAFERVDVHAAPAPRRPPCYRASGMGARAGNTSGRFCRAPRAPARARRR